MFHTNHGLFKPLVMFFGLTNSSITFQIMMNKIFTDLISQGVVTIYIDDILIYTKTKEEHNQIMCLVLEQLWEYPLYLKAEKCEFCQTKMYLPWHDHFWEYSQNGSCKSGRSMRLACSHQFKRSPIIPGLCQLLSTFYKRFCKNHEAYVQHNKKRHSFHMELKLSGSLWLIKVGNNINTCLTSPRSPETISTGMQ